MGIIQRFADIMSANINALLDKAEDPAKMIDKYLRDMQEDLAKVKSETATIMAEETRARRALDECDAEIARMQTYAEKAILAGNDGDARKFLEKKAQLTQNRESLAQTWQAASDNAAKMRQMHDKLCKDIADLNARREAVKAKVAVAKTQEKINKLGESVNQAQGSMNAFARMEAKADQMLDKANAEAELNRTAADPDGIEALSAKYDSAPGSAVEDELAALKAKLGK